MENIFWARKPAREAERLFNQREENVTRYFQSIYQNILKSGRHIDRVSQFMDETSENSNLPNKVLISRAIMDLAMPDDQGKLIVVNYKPIMKDDWLIQPDLNEDRLVLKLNTDFPVPKVSDGDLTGYEVKDVYKTAELLSQCGRHLELYGDKVMTRQGYKQLKGGF